MDTTIQGYMLGRLDEMQSLLRDIRSGQEKVLQFLQERPAVAVQTVATEPKTALQLDWQLGRKALGWVVVALYKNLPMIGTVIYMKATGQDEKILAYLNGLLGV